MSSQSKRKRGRPVGSGKKHPPKLPDQHTGVDEQCNIVTLDQTEASPEIEPDDAELVKQTLRDLCKDADAPAAARAQAARTLAEMANLLGRNAKPVVPDTKPVSEMSRQELETALSEL